MKAYSINQTNWISSGNQTNILVSVKEFIFVWVRHWHEWKRKSPSIPCYAVWLTCSCLWHLTLFVGAQVDSSEGLRRYRLNSERYGPAKCSENFSEQI